MARNFALLVLLAAALATANAATCPAATSTGPIQCYMGVNVTAPAGARVGTGACVCLCGSSMATATNFDGNGNQLMLISNSSSCTAAACKSSLAACGSAASVTPYFQSLSSQQLAGPVLGGAASINATAGSICAAYSITCTSAAVSAGFCSSYLLGLSVQTFTFVTMNAPSQCNTFVSSLASAGATAIVACSTTGCNTAAALAAAPAAPAATPTPTPAPAACPVSPSAGAISCYNGALITPPPAIAGGGICTCDCGSSMAMATDSSAATGNTMQIAVGASSACTAAACKSNFPFCSSSSYVSPMYQTFANASTTTLTPVGAGAICGTASYTCNSALISAGVCPLGSLGGSIVTYNFLNGSTASVSCAGIVSVAGTLGGISTSFCSTSGCNSPSAAKMSSPAARPAVASLRALAAVAAAFALLLL